MSTPLRQAVMQRQEQTFAPRRKSGVKLALLIVVLLVVIAGIVFSAISILKRVSVPASGNGAGHAGRQYSIVAAEGEQYGPPGTPPDQMVLYTKPVDHVFFHPLIAYPEKAFDFDYQAKGFDDYFVTVSEFNKIIASMYERGYMMVDINDVYEKGADANGKVKYRQKPLLMPKGKIPFILSIDDVNYYPYMIENGVITKLVLDENGEAAAYTTTPAGETKVVRDLDIVPIIDDFVKKHPDFSLNNAKGLIGLTGYEGVLGYRTYVKNNPGRESEIELVKPVIRRLKETGWQFASHSYGHYDAAVISYDKLKSDTQRWKDEVEPLIGPTQIYIYPFGSGVKTTDPKFKMFVSLGFTMMCTVGNEAYYAYTDIGATSSRWHFDGIALRYQGNSTSNFYDAAAVIDPVRPVQYQKK